MGGNHLQNDRTLHGFLAASAARSPQACAIFVPAGKGRDIDQAITYADLAAQSDALARAILARIPATAVRAGVGAAEPVVALHLPRTSPLLYLAQLAALKAGAAFTCLDPAFPDGRVVDILADARPVLVLAEDAQRTRLGQLVDGACPVENPAQLLAAAPALETPLPHVAPEALAYLIYTSGTTGKPKGVMIEHRHIANLVASDLAEFALGPGDRVVQGSSVAYDSSIEEIWLALASGATLLVMDDAAARLGPDIVAWLADHRASVFCPPPTLLRSSGCSNPQEALPDLKLLYVGGEALPADIAALWAKGRRLVNGYGPTECAVTCLRGDILPGGPITIGRPVPGMYAFVLDEALDDVPEGSQGELCIGGTGVARGYLGRPDLTAEKFIHHPRHGRLYRTGDLVHRDETGNLFYHGRIDAQVKIRGYRVELGEIEAQLAALAGVRAAGATIQDRGGVPELVAYVVPTDPAAPPLGEALRQALAASLPGYMVPRQVGLIAALPTTVGGKLDRKALPPMHFAPRREDEAQVPPESELEALIAQAMADVLKRPGGVSVTADFFEGLGGDSLTAAMLVTLLREDWRTDWVTVSDIYDARTVRALAARAPEPTETTADAAMPLLRQGVARPALANLVQVTWLALSVLVAGWGSWLVAFRVAPLAFAHLGLATLVLVAPLVGLAGFLLYMPLSVAFAVAVKWLAIGRYRPLRAPVWSPYYLRHWMVMQAVRLIPWPLLAGTELNNAVLRLLGARIGRRVHIHRNVDLRRGGWDLLDLGDDVSLGQGAHLGLVELDRGDIVVAPITMEAGAALMVRAGLEGPARMGAGSVLTALSVLNAGGVVPAGEMWDGVPAQRVGPAPAVPVITRAATRHGPWRHALLMLLGQGLFAALAALPGELLLLGLCLAGEVDALAIWRWMAAPSLDLRVITAVLATTVLAVPLNVFWSALLLRALGRVRPGVIDRWSLGYIRVWIKAGAVFAAGEWLSGTLMFKHWLRLAGMNVGDKCEISTIFDVTPELVTIGAETFFADGIYLGGPELRQGTVRVAPIRLGRNTFLGNHAVIPAGETLPDDILIGISTVADATLIARGQSRFGHPSFDLPRRQVVEADRSLTHDPALIRQVNRWVWELARFALPVVPLVLGALWFAAIGAAAAHGAGVGLMAWVVVPAATLGTMVALCLVVMALKWGLIGRVKPGQHALWSCWCSRWDFVYVAWARYANFILQQLEGTFLLLAYLRLMGLRIGRRAVLGPLFAQVVDPDMIEIGDGATVHANFQAHTFEDRVLKVDKVRIGTGATVHAGTVPLYGAVVDAGTRVLGGSVIMKHEHLRPGLAYQGVPVRVVG
ncbi:MULTISPECIES: non-ribosomal peptide synthetase [unclassified Sphingomonas]|uniref:non-ribosomal peptide synthetase n=1 Tax=Novosphingobium rhizosphaerae TaxID=1551649 RepID=UPI0015CAA8B5